MRKNVKSKARHFSFQPASAFTLVELMVVIGIIGLLLAITVPAIGPLLASNSMSEAQNTINGLLTTAQVQAEANATPVAIRIERAFATGPKNINGTTYEVMDTIPGSPPQTKQWLDYQQARFVIFASRQVPAGAGFKNQIFEQIPSSKVVTLPKGAWLAPDYSLQPGTDFSAANLAEATLLWQPTNLNGSPNLNAVPYNRFETFYIVFNKLGELSRYPATNIVYKDHTQAYPNPAFPATPPVPPALDPIVDHPDDSARGLLIYDREAYNRFAPTDAQGRLTYLQREARPVFLNKSMGSVVEEKKQ
jgi:prepilin-type N-terminal cleavage/methylation domain-containing protein